jgi:hypothetical protein
MQAGQSQPDREDCVRAVTCITAGWLAWCVRASCWWFRCRDCSRARSWASSSWWVSAWRSACSARARSRCAVHRGRGWPPGRRSRMQPAHRRLSKPPRPRPAESASARTRCWPTSAPTPLWWTCTSTGRPEAITSSPWFRWSAAARVGHFRTWHVALGCTGSTTEPRSTAIFPPGPPYHRHARTVPSHGDQRPRTRDQGPRTQRTPRASPSPRCCGTSAQTRHPYPELCDTMACGVSAETSHAIA